MGVPQNLSGGGPDQCEGFPRPPHPQGGDGGDLDLRVGFFLSPNALPWDGDGMNQVISLFQAPVGHLPIGRHGGRLMEEMKQTAFVQRMQRVN